MKQVFSEKGLQDAFEKSVQMHEDFRKVVSKRVDCANPSEVVQHMSELTEVMVKGITAKAQFQFLTEKLSFQKAMNLNNEDMGVTEKKIIIAYEIGDCSFYNTLSELLIKEAHYKMDMLRSALSFSKSEMAMI
jgi:hypothetical protein